MYRKLNRERPWADDPQAGGIQLDTCIKYSKESVAGYSNRPAEKFSLFFQIQLQGIHFHAFPGGKETDLSAAFGEWRRERSPG